MMFDFIIAGASQAGLHAATEIRNLKALSTILILDKENTWPYKRTKLSKNLLNPMKDDAWLLHEKQWYTDMKIELMTETELTAVNPEEKTVTTKNGNTFTYGKLLLATGSSSFRLPIPGSQFIHTLRDKTDASDIIKKLKQAEDVIVIGQGVEGMELAEQARLSEKKVTVIGHDSHIMERWFNEKYSQKIQQLYEKAGVKFITKTRCNQIIQRKTGYDVVTDKGSFSADLVLGSTGIIANTKFLPSPEEPLNTLKTKWKDVYAAGDIMSLPPEYSPGLWHAAEEQGKAAGRLMAGGNAELTGVPYRLKIEVFGTFWYSQGYSTLKGRETEEILLDDAEKNITTWSDDSGLVKAVLMRGLPEKGKALQKLVRQGCTNTDILKLTESTD